MVDEQSDAELIERARNLHLWSPPHVQKREQCRMLKTLADRLAELTTPEPWRSPSEPPQAGNHVWVRYEGSGTQVTRGFVCPLGKWHKAFSVDGQCARIRRPTGWQPIVRPLP